MGRHESAMFWDGCEVDRYGVAGVVWVEGYDRFLYVLGMGEEDSVVCAYDDNGSLKFCDCFGDMELVMIGFDAALVSIEELVWMDCLLLGELLAMGLCEFVCVEGEGFGMSGSFVLDGWILYGVSLLSWIGGHGFVIGGPAYFALIGGPSRWEMVFKVGDGLQAIFSSGGGWFVALLYDDDGRGWFSALSLVFLHFSVVGIVVILPLDHNLQVVH
ncbi:hypothetical protein Dimus_024397 [Dionaea muscipula]